MKSLKSLCIVSLITVLLCISISVSAEISPTKINEMVNKLQQQKINVLTLLSAPNMSEKDTNQVPTDIKTIRSDIQKIRDALNVLIENQQVILENSKK